jgi:hypothetical protein
METSKIKRTRLVLENKIIRKSISSPIKELITINNKDINCSIPNRLIQPIKSLGTIVSITTTLFILSCSSPAEKVENAEAGVQQANDDLDKAQEEYTADVKLFRQETDLIIAENEKEIAAINVKIKKNTSTKRAEYEKQITILEQKNKELKQQMDNYKADTNKDWQLFKTKFSKDLKELGLALKNFVTDSN